MLLIDFDSLQHHRLVVAVRRSEFALQPDCMSQGQAEAAQVSPTERPGQAGYGSAKDGAWARHGVFCSAWICKALHQYRVHTTEQENFSWSCVFVGQFRSLDNSRRWEQIVTKPPPPPPHPGSHPCGYQLDPCWTQRNFREETTPQWRYLADYTRITTAMLHAIFTRSQYLEEATWKLEIYITAQFYETMTDMRDIKPLFPLTGSYELPVGAVHWRGTVNSKS